MTDKYNEVESIDATLSFSQAITKITSILYRQRKEKKPIIYSFDEFRTTMEEKDARLKSSSEKTAFIYLLLSLWDS